MNSKVKVALGVIAALIIIAVPFIVLGGHEFAGTDDQAVEMIGTLSKGYEPWADSPLEISDEAEGLFFTLQAVLGASILGFCLGRITSKPKLEDK
ncbi:MAG: energy-coupling factor ABC transporter substrate-binding protein [Erysipelotrichales bacterium]